MKTIYLNEYIGKRIKIYSKEYSLLSFDFKITGKNKKTKVILKDRILTDKGILSNPIILFDETKFIVL